MFTFSFHNVLYMLMLILAEAIHIRNSERRENFALRLSISFAILFVLSAIIPKCTLNTIWGNTYNTAVRLVLFLLTVPLSYIPFEIDLFYAFSRCMYGNVTCCCANVYASSMVLLLGLTGFAVPACYIFVFAIVYGIFFFFSLRKDKNRDRRVDARIRTFMIMFLVAAAYSFAWTDISKSVPASMIISSFFIVYLGYMLANIFVDEKHLNEEYAIMKSLMEKEAQQYETTKELIDSINLKSHDLKHQIRHLWRSGAVINEEILREIEDAVEAYDAGFKTGNDALDIIMTEKSRQCLKNEIRIACVADGQKLSFMEPKDIYSMVGNILDNAIEAVQRLDDPEMRTINFSVRQEYGLVRIRAENYYAGNIQFQNNLPITSKEDNLWHGYGTKSVRSVAEKYEGVAEFTAQGNVFSVNVLIPFVQ